MQRNSVLIKEIGGNFFSFPVGNDEVVFHYEDDEVYIADTLEMTNSEDRAILNTRIAFQILKQYKRRVYSYDNDFKKIDASIRRCCRMNRELLADFRHSKRDNRRFALRLRILEICDRIRFLIRHKRLIQSYVLEKELSNERIKHWDKKAY